MTRWIAGIAAILLLVTGAVLALQSRAEAPELPPAPEPRLAAVSTRLSPIPNAPEADAKSKEEKRFARADKDENGRISLAELIEPRRNAFAKLDLDHDGKLSFEEWAVRTIDKFAEADADKNRALTPAEYATTAPKPKPKKPACACG
ncbi:histidine kinase [Sphingomonas sp.]|uniref:histidine kinase n=1 Tax=Sphingomonas sp. TaxID=28214 RepID=UPI0025D201B8|nr:histidine kinase [Sphingomonas sp.]